MKIRLALMTVILLCGTAILVSDCGKDPPATPVAAVAGEAAEPFHQGGFIYEEQPGVMAHVASIAPLEEGAMAAVWYAGSREGARDVAIFFARYDGRQWQETRLLVDRRSCSRDTGMRVKKIGNPVVFRDLQSRLWLVYSSVVEGGWSATSLNYKVSDDFGETWTPSRKLFLSPLLNLTYNVKNKPVLLDDGSFLLPVYHEMLAKRSAVLHVTPEKETVTYQIRRITFQARAIQAAMFPLGGRRLMALFRNMDGGQVLAARSNDVGRTWSDPYPIDLPNPDAGFDAVRLGSGTILAAINNSREDRSNLSLAVSDDEGASWQIARVLQQHPGMEYSYPSLAMDDLGLIHLVYTYERKSIRHEVFSEAWLHGNPSREPVQRSRHSDEVPGRPSRVPYEWDGSPRVGALSYATALLALLSLAAAGLTRLRLMHWRWAGRWGLFLATIIAALLLTLIQIDGLSAVDLLLSLSPSLSVLCLGLVLHNYSNAVFGLPLLHPKELLYWAGFVLVLSIPLFASVLGGIPVDLYAYGYRFSWIHVVAVGFGLYVAWRGHNGLAAILLAALAAYYLRLLPSGNVFDALTDGLVFFIAIGIVAQCTGRALKHRLVRVQRRNAACAATP
ncbi:MAG: sialidase family protein [Thermoguttaceae bacterium]|jgi:predicted neuraminidase|nr:sialidase family protein [Thermoguttaceae bacterium]